jgi:hypothetical protein
MTADKFSNVPFNIELKLEELRRLMGVSEWEIFEQAIALAPEEAERILRESEWIDISEVNRLLEFTEEDFSANSTNPSHSQAGLT